MACIACSSGGASSVLLFNKLSVLRSLWSAPLQMSLNSPHTNQGGRKSEGGQGCFEPILTPQTTSLLCQLLSLRQLSKMVLGKKKRVSGGWRGGVLLSTWASRQAEFNQPRSRAVQITAGARAQVITHLFNLIRRETEEALRPSNPTLIYFWWIGLGSPSPTSVCLLLHVGEWVGGWLGKARRNELK